MWERGDLWEGGFLTAPSSLFLSGEASAEERGPKLYSISDQNVKNYTKILD